MVRPFLSSLDKINFIIREIMKNPGMSLKKKKIIISATVGILKPKSFIK